MMLTKAAARCFTIARPAPFLIAAMLPTAAACNAQETAASTAASEDAIAAVADDDRQDKLQTITLAGGRLRLELPARWSKVNPRNRIIELELAVPPAEGEDVPGRLTMMRSGGGVEANIRRWKGQFTVPPDTDPKQASSTKKLEVDGLAVHVIGLSGTYLDRPRPFGPGVERPGYRMLAAIIETKVAGDYFIKFYAPAPTVKANEKAFHRMIGQLRWSGE